MRISDWSSDVCSSDLTLVGLGFGIVAHLIWRLYAEREGDLIQKRYDARAMVALLLGGLLLIDLSVDLLFGFAWRPLPFAMVQNAAILGFSIWLAGQRSEEHTSELQSLMRISYAVFCLKKKKNTSITNNKNMTH